MGKAPIDPNALYSAYAPRTIAASSKPNDVEALLPIPTKLTPLKPGFVVGPPGHLWHKLFIFDGDQGASTYLATVMTERHGIAHFRMSPPTAHAPLFNGNKPSAAAVAAVLAHPQFAEAMRIIAAGHVAIYSGDRLLNRVVTDRWRNLISIFAVHLHLTGRPGDPRSGLTSSRMAALCAEHKVCSPGRVRATLTLMRLFGHLAPAPSETDRRLRRLVPTERLLARHRAHHSVIFRAMAKVLPEGERALAAVHSSEFMSHFMRRLSQSYLAGFYYVNHIPEMRLFLERDAGMMILYSLALSAEADDAFPPTRSLAVVRSALARNFGISRAHARRIFDDGVNTGLLERTGARGDQFRILPPLMDAFRRVLAVCIVHNAHCARQAIADVAQLGAVA